MRATALTARSDCVIVEFRFVSLINVYLKRIWYACFGALHGKTKLALGRMNALLDEEPVVARADPRWLVRDRRVGWCAG